VPIPIEAATPRQASDPTVLADRVTGPAVATASGADCPGAAGGTAVAVTSGRSARWYRSARLVPGLAAAIVLAIIATLLGRLEPVIGGPVFAFNIVAVLLYPAIGHLLGLSQHAFGLWSGTAINDTSSAAAAAYTYGAAAGDYSVVVKLTRTLMIIPICLGLAFWQARRHRRRALAAGVTTAAPAVPWRRMFPWFIVYFLAAVAANSLGLIPHGWHAPLSQAAVFLITTALVGIGLATRVGDMRRTGLRPLALGAVLWATVGISSLLLQLLSGQL
jgi:uncharacterized membrane protein YadS